MSDTPTRETPTRETTTQETTTSDTPTTDILEDSDFAAPPQGPQPGAEAAGATGSAGWLRWMWRQLTSMRVALILLFLLALAAIPGSILPQRSQNAIKVREWIEAHPASGPIVDALGGFDAYSSPWFAAIYLLLCISVIGCVVPRSAQHAKALRNPPPPAPRNLSRMPVGSSWTSAADPTEALGTARANLRGWRIRMSDDPGSGNAPTWLSAERGYLRETGNLLFHTSLILMLIGVAAGALLGWRGNVIVREGSGFSNTLTQYDAFGAGPLADPAQIPPFSFTLDDFSVTFEREGSQKGAPRSFEAAITYTPEPGATPQKKVVKVNDPLRIDGSTMYLVGHGYAPHVVIKDSTGKVVFDDTVAFLPQDGNFLSTGVIKAPDAKPQLGLQGVFLPTAFLDPVRGGISIFPEADNPQLFLGAFTGDLGMDDGVPRSVFSLDTDKLTKLGIKALQPGATWQLPNGQGSVTFVDYQRWASFQIAHNPGQLLALAAAGLGLAGLLLSLFIRRRRVWVRAVEGEDGTIIEIAGLDRNEGGHVSADVSALAAAVLATCPVKPLSVSREKIDAQALPEEHV